MTCVYFLYLSNGDVYKGCTDDLERWLEEHYAGKVESTGHYRPMKLIGFEAYCLKSDALRREKFLKSTEGRRLFQRQYRDILEFIGSDKERCLSGCPPIILAEKNNFLNG